MPKRRKNEDMNKDNLTPPTQLYQGYDSFQGQVRDTITTGKTTTPSNAQSTNSVYICTDTESVMQAISVSASASMAGSFDAKMTWARSLSLTSTSVAIIVHTVVVIGEQQAEGYSYQGSPTTAVQAFFNEYGDSFVSDIVLGGEYLAAFMFDSTTFEQQQTIKASLSGSVDTFASSLSTAITNTQSSTKTTLRYSQKMFGVSKPQYPRDDADDVVKFALSFGKSSPLDAPTVLSFKTVGYDRVPGITGFEPVADNRELLSVPFVQAYLTLSSMLSQIELIREVYKVYGYTGDTQFKTKAAQVSADFDTVNQLMDSIEKDVIHTYSPPLLPSLSYGAPLVSYTLNPPIGPGGSGSFFDVTPALIAQGVIPSAIAVFRAAWNRDTDTYYSAGIQVNYSDSTIKKHGTTWQANMHTISLQADSISAVSVGTAIGYDPQISYVFDILIQTAQGQSIESNAGGINVTVSNYNAPLIIGFCGADGFPTLTALTPIAITMLPAKWGS
jgi:hypothetical protein